MRLPCSLVDGVEIIKSQQRCAGCRTRTLREILQTKHFMTLTKQIIIGGLALWLPLAAFRHGLETLVSPARD